MAVPRACAPGEFSQHDFGTHRRPRVWHKRRFALYFLPSYSPELNPIERVWKLTRRRRLHNRHFPLLKDVATAVESLFAEWTTGNDTLRRLCATI